MHGVAPSGTFHFINKLDRVKDLHSSPGEGLVVDEISLADRHIDDVKGLLDLAKTRDVGCRNKDGAIPMRTPRIITTNWSWETFWPQAMFLKEHRAAIQRRVIWVPVTKDLRRAGNAGAWRVMLEMMWKIPLATAAAWMPELSLFAGQACD